MPQTFGQFLVNDALPKDLQATGALNKSDLYSRVYTMARRDPKDAAVRIDKLRSLGHELATLEGMTVGLDDIAPDPKKDAVMKPLMAEMKRTRDEGKRLKILKRAEEKMLALTAKHPGSMGEMVRSGGRGKSIQLMRTANAAVHAKDPVLGTPYPWLIPHGYSEGLKPSEDFLASMESRTNLMDSNLAVVEPGSMSKVIVNAMNDQLVLSEDCGTHNGLMMNSENPQIVDRYLARAEVGFPRNTLITPHVATSLRRKAKRIMVRSVVTCELNEGICQKCYGLGEYGQVHGIGTNLGVMSAQALTEPLTQFALAARHGVRGKTTDVKQVGGLKGLQQQLEIPASFINGAKLAAKAGKVETIEPAPQGGFDIRVGEDNYYVPAGLDPVVRVGQHVEPGDVLTDGVPRPDEVIAHKGLGAGRKYMVDSLSDLYKGVGLDIDMRHVELLAKSHMNHVRIDADPEGRYLPGEIVNYNNFMKSLAEDVKDKSVKEAEGEVLARGYLHHTAGTPVTRAIRKELEASGIRVVNVTPHPPIITPYMRPLSRHPLLNPDWMARLGSRYLKESILEGAHVGQVSDLSGTHPTPAYIYGRTFGRGVGGRY